jgi:ATP-dependent RNA helicase RhlE
MSFADLGLTPELLRAVAEKGYTTPTPIQSQAIPAVLSGRDVLAGAQTGTGKTAAFVLPILQKLGAHGANRAPRALVLTPTRELAAQVAESARSYGKYAGLRTVVVFGGVGINPQIDALRNGCDILVATPGRLLDLAEQRAVDLRGVQYFVLDEADRMLDMGFIHQIKRVLKLVPPVRQNMMFSATYSEDIRELASRFLRNPATVEVAARNATADRVDQQVYRVSKDHKRHLLAHLIDDGGWHQVLVFTRTKHGANRLAQQLEGNGIRSAAIHGNKSQAARVRALADFKAHVVNYELPNVPEDYVHRIGRTARAGGAGCAVSLVSPDETPLLKDIERLLRRSLPVAALPQFPITVPTHRPESQSSPEQAGASAPEARGDGNGQRRDSRGHGGRNQGGGRGRSQVHGGGRGNGHGQSRGQNHGQRHGQGHGDSRGQGNGQSAGQSRAAGQGQSHGDSRSHGNGQSLGQSRGNGHGASRGDNRGNGHGQSRGTGTGQYRGRGNSGGGGPRQGLSSRSRPGNSRLA